MPFDSGLFAAVMVLFVVASLYAWFKFFKKETKKEIQENVGTQMKLQSYERLTLLVDRIALPNLITRCNTSDIGIREMQQLLIHNIKEEYQYNVSQQIYVSNDAWNAVKNLKDQNLLIINQIASVLPNTLSGADLNRTIIEFLMNDPKGELHNIVSDVLSYEAKKLMA
jgi:hypothetical protein